jgi:U11/U12 small nuclear ribonucleoprotein SNRNP35
MNKYEKNIKKSNVELAYEFNFQHAKDYGFYDPVMAGSIDGTDEKPHDHGIIRALESTHYKPNSTVKSNPDKTLFIGRINYKTNEETLLKIFSKFGNL